MEERKPWVNGIGKLVSHIQKSRILPKPYLTSCTKINKKYIENLSIRPESINSIEENMVYSWYPLQKHLQWFNIYDQIYKSKDKFNYWKIRNFCTAKEVLNQNKDTINWEKIFPRYVLSKWLIFKIKMALAK